MSIRNRISQYLASVMATRVRFASGERIVGKTTAGAGYGSELTAAQARTFIGAQASMTAASQAEMEAGTEAAIRSMSPLRVAQAIAALATNVPDPTALTFAGVDPRGYAYAYLDLGPVAGAGNFVENDTIEINGTNYIFKASPTLPNHVDIGADLDESIVNLLAKIATDSDVIARFQGSGNLRVQSAVAGTGGNAITVSESLAVGGPWAEEVDYGTPTATLANGATAVSASFLGQECDAATATWRWNDTTWIPIRLLNGDPITYSTAQAAYFSIGVDADSALELTAFP